MRTSLRRAAATALAFFVAACGGDDATGPSADVDILVGDWSAIELTVINDADPSQTADLIETGATFTINVQESGQYTATLTFLGFPSTEIGFLRIDGDEIVFTREFPSADTSRATFRISGNRITLEGDTEFDFDGDSQGDPATLRSVLERS